MTDSLVALVSREMRRKIRNSDVEPIDVAVDATRSRLEKAKKEN